MPVPRSILDRSPAAALDLEVVGAWPTDIEGEILIATADQASAVGGHAFYGDGVLIRLGLRPGTMGHRRAATPGDRAGSTRRRRVCATCGPTCSPPPPSAPRRPSASPTRRTPRPCRGTVVCS
jgi:hypothetical protein